MKSCGRSDSPSLGHTGVKRVVRFTVPSFRVPKETFLYVTHKLIHAIRLDIQRRCRVEATMTSFTYIGRFKATTYSLDEESQRRFSTVSTGFLVLLLLIMFMSDKR